MFHNGIVRELTEELTVKGCVSHFLNRNFRNITLVRF